MCEGLKIFRKKLVVVTEEPNYKLAAAGLLGGSELGEVKKEEVVGA